MTEIIANEVNLASLLFNEQIFLDMSQQTKKQSPFFFYYGAKKISKGSQRTSTNHSALQVSLYSYENDPDFAIVEGKKAPT